VPDLNPLWVFGYAVVQSFTFWPLSLIALMWRGRGIEAMLSFWFLFLMSWVVRRLWVPGPLLHLIPEPLNTYMFFVTGVVLIAAAAFRIARDRRPPTITPDNAETPEDLCKLSTGQFLKMVATMYQRRGYQARPAGLLNDGGVDLIVFTPRGQKWIVQCNRARGPVSAHAVRDFYGALQHNRAARGIVVTTGTFSPEAHQWAVGKQLALVDGKAFLYAWKEPRES
jgi:restriction system protein